MNNASVNISVPISDQHRPSFPSDVYPGIDLTSSEHVMFRLSRFAKPFLLVYHSEFPLGIYVSQLLTSSQSLGILLLIIFKLVGG